MSTMTAVDAGALRAACSDAAAAAEARFGDGLPPAWEPAARLRLPPLRRKFCIAGSGVAVALALLAWALNSHVADVPPAPSGAAVPSIIEGRPSAEVAEGAGPARVAQAKSPPATTDLLVDRRGRLWQIEAAGASRLDAARLLAEQSGSTLHGSTELLSRAAPLSVRWQGRSLAQAWQQVLGTDVSYALQCRRDVCEAWIVAASTQHASPSPTLPLRKTAVPIVQDAFDDRGAVSPPDSGHFSATGDAGASYH